MSIITENQKNKIRRLYDDGLSTSEISRHMRLPEYNVRYYRPGGAERMNAYQKVYYDEHLKTPDLRNVESLVERVNGSGRAAVSYDPDNIYVSILRGLNDPRRYGATSRSLARGIMKYRKNEAKPVVDAYQVAGGISVLIRFGFVARNPGSRKRSLTGKGKDFCEYLFSEAKKDHAAGAAADVSP